MKASLHPKDWIYSPDVEGGELLVAGPGLGVLVQVPPSADQPRHLLRQPQLLPGASDGCKLLIFRAIYPESEF